jgi:hypothetical protein
MCSGPWHHPSTPGLCGWLSAPSPWRRARHLYLTPWDRCGAPLHYKSAGFFSPP